MTHLVKFGWCLDGHHSDCRREINGTNRALRCSCPCHGEVPD